MSRQERWAQAASYWQMVPRKTYVVLLAGIFCLFVALGYVMTFLSEGWWYIGWAGLSALASGVFAVGYAHASFRRIIWMMVLMLPLQFLVVGSISHLANKYARPMTAADF